MTYIIVKKNNLKYFYKICLTKTISHENETTFHIYGLMFITIKRADLLA